MARQLEILLNGQLFQNEDLVFHEGLWHSWLHHSRFSGTDPGQVLRTINGEVSAAAEFLRKAQMLVLTFGTAGVYQLVADNRIVSNCHKLPASLFYTSRPGPEELADRWIPLIQSLHAENPDLRICLTVSPVRYLKEGPLGNQLSKSTLFLLIDRLLREFPFVRYFPSYELFMDDLRDYRFYDDDLMHPGSQGVAYIWEKFSTACMDPASRKTAEEIESVLRSLNHRPSGHLTGEHGRFLEQLKLQLENLQKRFPGIDFTPELQRLGSLAASDQP
jgi:hypothetical protein